MRTPIGRFSRFSVVLIVLVGGTIVAGVIVPGHTGSVIELVGWLALALCIISVAAAILRSRLPNEYNGDVRRPDRR
jgi:hypothetical protein